MLEGKKTYLGIATVAIGLVLSWLGIGQCDLAAADCQSAETLATQLTGVIDQILMVGGMILAAYGRAKAKPKA